MQGWISSPQTWVPEQQVEHMHWQLGWHLACGTVYAGQKSSRVAFDVWVYHVAQVHKCLKGTNINTMKLYIYIKHIKSSMT